MRNTTPDISIWLARPRSVSTPQVKKKLPVPLILHNIFANPCANEEETKSLQGEKKNYLVSKNVAYSDDAVQNQGAAHQMHVNMPGKNGNANKL